jgi:hypothetical protein
MDFSGLCLCSRFSYPPNSFSLCGPDKQKDLQWYTSFQQPDKGTKEILMQFSTLYPYLSFIAYENNIHDQFDIRVIEAYWIGNSLLENISQRKFAIHLSDTLGLKRKVNQKQITSLLEKIQQGALPFHAFHVLNVYKRTGSLDILHTIQSMDACIINWGKVKKISKKNITISTRPVTVHKQKLVFGPVRLRDLLTQGDNDVLAKRIVVGDWVSYHWGYFCQILNSEQLKNLIYYTRLSMQLADSII